MSSIKEPLGRTEEERDYNSLNRRAWAIFAPFYDDYALPRNRVVASSLAYHLVKLYERDHTRPCSAHAAS